MSTILLVRHGETEWNAGGRIQGWAPVALAETGRREAERVATHLADAYDVDAVVSSDLTRATETADAIADAVGATVETDRRLRERDFGVYQGLPSGTFFERFPELDLLENGADAAAYTPESGESWLDVRRRVRAAAADLAARPGTVVAVTHVNPIRLLVGERTGRDVVESLTEIDADNCSVTGIGEDGRVVSENGTGFLD
ncbi:histidine phosphatase family protein [Halorubrum sp. JWXQ-INN 858]|uniref:histidine phosphatase family protein n=1 Tax=Halorubrum sp. JWXQ-INN 858 TaxID=2690782 RepID=UPI0013FC8C44|nr:histidine phosphatase family protein [Halorubrum sp. JWXQ-INN 858]MWV63444.1 histidine phosphatase family protein [Halorubrum sp. JWXQ-INN 858]